MGGVVTVQGDAGVSVEMDNAYKLLWLEKTSRKDREGRKKISS
jgi:hypothetical protein